MRKEFVLISLLIFVPLASACYNPMDSLAVEVRLNRPGIYYDLTPLKNAENVIIDDGSIIYRSHYDERVAVILKEVNSSLWIRIQIPAKSFESTYAHASFESPLLISNESFERIKALGWEVKNYTFKKESLYIQISPKNGDECRRDSECAVGGCSGEVCTTKDLAREIVTPCVYKEWYGCLRLTSCGCYNGFCTWKPNPDFEKCLKEHGIDPSKVIKLPLAEVYIADYGKEKPSEEDIGELRELFEVLGISCAFDKLQFKSGTIDTPVGIIDPYSFNFSEALRVELEWLRENGIIAVGDEDISAIVEVAEKGKSGYNSHIGWYEKGGKYSWIAYDESDNPLLLRCVGQPFELKLPSGQVELSQTTTQSDTTSQQTGTICGPGLILGLVLVARVFRK
ncbi:CGP-CTERM-anchored Cys-rich protein [Thermococcus sp. PK]|uniref:CGP-CTERM-anchored Cys-rich protein n=1 Tax=Thermococcus sp. PK TaxID=913025 RepID=UPI0005B29F74|nr:CGP-CTERM-anchored Cys-rich protein [Thermococcus sp. PK]